MRMIVAALALTVLAATSPPDAIQIDSAKIAWKDAAPPLPAGAKSAALEGDPRKPGMFTIRVRIPAGSKIAPHWHPRPERVTILAGELRLGFGDAFDETTVTKLRSGDFYINPALSHHYLYFDRDTELQITGEGPWELHLLP